MTESLSADPTERSGSSLTRILVGPKTGLNFLLDRLIDWADDMVMRVGSTDQRPTLLERTIHCVGDVASCLRQAPRSDVYHLYESQWSVVCVGSEITKNELCRVLFSDRPQECGPDRIALWQIPGAMHRWLADADLVVLQHGRWQPWKPQARYAFSICPSIRQVLDISPSRDIVISRMHSERRRHWRKMSRLGFTFDYTRQLDDFEVFYHTMYVPYISARHTNRAVISPYGIHKLYFDSGGLIFIRYEDQCVAGVLCRAVRDVCQVGPLGVREGCFNLVQKELMLAIYWSTVEWAWERKLKIVDWNYSRGWQSDGVFRFKRYWGTRIVSDKQTHDTWSFFTNHPSPALLEQLNRVGFITELDGQHYGILVLDEGRLPVDLDLDRLQRVARRDGLVDLLLVSPGLCVPLSQFRQAQLSGDER